jgi:protein-tyrosine phosphatase
MVRICFVCLGNICRSPTEEGVMAHLVDRAGLAAAIVIDSAGTSSYHVGERADARARKTAEGRGFKLPSRSRQFRAEDFARFEYVIAMDASNRQALLRLAPSESARARVHLLRDFDEKSPRGSDVPDPYYGGPEGFEEVFDICEAGCRGLLAHVRREHGL